MVFRSKAIFAAVVLALVAFAEADRASADTITFGAQYIPTHCTSQLTGLTIAVNTAEASPDQR
jgi:hypothetical protein